MSYAVIALLALGLGAMLAALIDWFTQGSELGYYRPGKHVRRSDFSHFIRTVRNKSARV